MKKITLRLGHAEMANFLFAATPDNVALGNAMRIQDTNALVARITGSLSTDERDAVIGVSVKQAIARLRGLDPDSIADDHHLGNTGPKHLNLTDIQIQSLSVPFTHIARAYNGDALITPDDCAKQDTVKDCIDLVIAAV